MGFVTKAAVVVIIIAVWWGFRSKPPPLEDLGNGSFVAPGWEKVEAEFRRLLKNGLLTAGAYSVYHKGKCVVELSGGYANEDSLKKWDSNTLCIYFSSTKGVASIVIANLVDRGLLDYNKPVSSYWPEFAQNGKKDITVEQLLSHQAGLITINGGNYSFFDARDENWENFVKVLASQKPYWEPGKGIGYHALTKGFYEDALVRKVDPKHRSMQRFFREEIADVFGIDFHIGIPPSEFYRLSKNHQMSFFDSSLLTDSKTWSLLWLLTSPNSKLFPISIATDEQHIPGYWNNPDFMGLNSPASHGVGTGRSLAKLYGILANGGVYNKKKLLSEKLIAKLGKKVVSGFDKVLHLNWTLGPGTMLTPPPEKISDIGKILPTTDKGVNTFGTPGAGGQMAFADPKNNLGVSYLTNHMSWYGLGNDPRFISLTKAVYESLKQMNQEDKK